MKKILSMVTALALAATLLPAQNVSAAEMNWEKKDGVWYATNDAGEQIKGWYKDANNCWYFLDWTTGAMKTGWVASGSDWYYMNPANGIMQTGWQKVGGNWYYMQTSGAKAGSMQKGSQLIDGAKQNLDPESGKLVNKGEPMFTGYENVDALIKQILGEIIKPGMTEREELKAIHDYVAQTVSYGNHGMIYGNNKKEDEKVLGDLVDGLKHMTTGFMTESKSEYMIYNGYIALTVGKGVCQDYTAAFNLLADALGYKTTYMNGKYDGSGHEWSLVWLNGEWMIMDVQLDDYKDDGSLVDIGFLRHNGEDNKRTGSANQYFNYFNPEDHMIQVIRASLIEHPEYEEKFGTFKEQVEKNSQNYLYTGK